MISYFYFLIWVIFFNTLPILAPPTWIVIADLIVKWHLDPFSAILLGVIGATLGRLAMYYYSKWFYKFLPTAKKKKLDKYAKILSHKKKNVAEAVFIYSLGPLPSNVLFILAGLMKLSPLPILTGFMLGRLVSYSFALFVLNKGVVALNLLGFDILPYLDVVVFIVTILLLFIDWESLLDKHIKHIN